MTATPLMIGYYRQHNPGLTEEARSRVARGADPVFVDTGEDPRADRPELRAAMALARQAVREENLQPVLVVTDLADLGRSLVHLVSTLRRILDLHGGVLILDDGPAAALWDTGDERADTLAAALPEPMRATDLARRLDRARASMASERVKRGHVQTGRTGGRPLALTDEQAIDAMHRLEAGEPASNIAYSFAVSRNTVIRAAERARTTHVKGEDTARGKGTSDEPPQDANQLRRT
jgi:DNA invertase Pin-like site-specific DNA recombinase